VTPFVADGGKAHSVLSRFADGSHPRCRRAQLGADQGFGLAGTGDHQAVEACALEFEGEIAGGERVSDETGKWGFGDDGKLSGGGETSAD
jgi:hypothetical protein